MNEMKKTFSETCDSIMAGGINTELQKIKDYQMCEVAAELIGSVLLDIVGDKLYPDQRIGGQDE